MRRPYNIMNSFVDMLFNILLGFFMLLLIAIVLVKPESKNKDIELKAEFMITMEWPNRNKDDVDLMVKTPLNQVVFFGQPNVKATSLDRDDRGGVNDLIKLEDGTKVLIEENWEHITLRKSFKGEYVVNIHMFNKREKTPTPVKVKIERLNPYRLIYAKTRTLTRNKEEATVLRFTMDSNGNVIDRTTLPYSIKNKMRRRNR